FALLAQHELDFAAEVSVLAGMVSGAALSAAKFALMYAGLEPYVRRRWPERLISWLRLVGGKLRDPMIGRDLLIGIAAGVAHALLATVSGVLPAQLGIAQMGLPRVFAVPAFEGVLPALGAVLDLLREATLVALVMMVLLVAMTLIFRRRRLAIVGLFAIQMLGFAAAVRGNVPVLISCVFISLVYTVVIVRVGFLAVLALQFTFNIV